VQNTVVIMVLHATAYSLIVVSGDPYVLYLEHYIKLYMFCIGKAFIDRVNWPFLIIGVRPYQYDFISAKMK